MLLKSDALHERLDCQDVVLRAMCRIGYRYISRCTELIRAAKRGFLTSKETINVITEKDDFAHKVPDLSNLGEHVE